MPLVEVFSGFSVWSLALLIAGLVLLVLEMFQPGFGLMGGSGIFVLVIFVIVSARSLVHGLILGGFLLFIMLFLFLLFMWLGSKGYLPQKLILSGDLNSEEGYVAADFDRYLGAAGVAVSPLRPAGIMRVNGENLDVVSNGEFIEKGSKLRVRKVEGGRLVVELDS